MSESPVEEIKRLANEIETIKASCKIGSGVDKMEEGYNNLVLKVMGREIPITVQGYFSYRDNGKVSDRASQFQAILEGYFKEDIESRRKRILELTSKL